MEQEGVSNILRLELGWSRPRIFWGPGWAVICGAVASAGWDFSAQAFLTLLLCLFLVDGLLGGAWRAAMRVATLAQPEGLSNPDLKPKKPTLFPYSQPGSGGAKISAWLGEKLSAWRNAEETVRQVWIGVAITSLLVLLLGSFLGGEVLAIVALSLLLAFWAFLRARHGQNSLWLEAAYAGAASWLVGFAAISAGRGLSLGNPGLVNFALPLFWALVFLVIVFAYQRISQGGMGRVSLVISQVVGAIVLILSKQPILAGIFGMLLLAQMLFLSIRAGRNPAPWYPERIQAFTMLNMLLGAISLKVG